MTWVVSANGTQTATVPSTATFSNGTASIAVTNTANAGDMVALTTTSALPTNFAVGTTYYVISTGLSSSHIELSATPGGGAITAGSAGSGTQTATFEHVLTQDTNNATFFYQVDTSNMALGDLTSLRVYTEDDGGSTYVQEWKGTYQHVQINNQKASPFQPSETGIQVTLQQLAGTGRAFAWKLLRQ